MTATGVTNIMAVIGGELIKILAEAMIRLNSPFTLK